MSQAFVHVSSVLRSFCKITWSSGDKMGWYIRASLANSANKETGCCGKCHWCNRGRVLGLGMYLDGPLNVLVWILKTRHQLRLIDCAQPQSLQSTNAGHSGPHNGAVWLTTSCGTLHQRLIESNAFRKSMEMRAADRLFFLDSSMMCLSAKICATVVCFGLKIVLIAAVFSL